jgi:Domain of unknown function (DUF4956)
MPTAISLLAVLASDLAAIGLLAYVVYFRRYHRRDLLLAYVALNVGVLAVTTLLTSAVLVTLMYAVDHPRLGTRTHRQLVTLDAAYPDRAELHRALERLLAAEVRHTVVLEVDLVRDITMVDVRFRTPRPRRAPRSASARPVERVAS